MIIALLVITIGFIPIVLAINVLKIYKGSEIGLGLLLYMISITLWQMNIGVLYLKDFLSEELVLRLFQFLRVGPTFLIFLTFYIAYLIVVKHSPTFKNNTFYKIIQSLFNKKALWAFGIWSLFVYLINWTSLGIAGLDEISVTHSHTSFFFPVYGDMHFLYLIHSVSYFFLLLGMYIIANGLQNIYLKSFFIKFSFCSLLLFLTGFLNFLPGTGAILSSIGVVIFSSIIIFSFVKMNTLMTVKYNLLIERQKKLEYSGDIATSLIHEVKNNLQIIKSYSKLLTQAKGIPEENEKMVSMIQKSTQQLEDLTQNYTEYLNKKSIDFKMADLNEIIDESIEITSEILKKHKIDISFEKKYKPLKAYVSDIYLKQVFVNLIKNGSESVSEKSESRKMKIETIVRDDQIIIEISDTGKGIPEEDQELIFDPLFSSKKNGMGVGLPFVRKIIFEHRGQIKVTESSSKGTTFQVILPQYEFSDFI